MTHLGALLLDSEAEHVVEAQSGGVAQDDHCSQVSKEINNRCINKGESYCFEGASKPRSETINHVPNLPVSFAYPKEELQKVTSLDLPLPTASRDGHIIFDDAEGHTRYNDTWKVNSGSSGNPPNANFNRMFTDQSTKQIIRTMEGSSGLDQRPRESNRRETNGKAN